MAFLLTFGGLIMIVTGVNNTHGQLGAQLRSDFSGDKSFVPYAIALGSVGALGYVNALRQFSHLFMALILISLVLSNKGFFQNFTAGINATPVAPQAAAVPGANTNPQGQGFTGSSPLLDLGPLGNINPKLDPGGLASKVYQLFGGTTH